ncbi:MAG: ABC transporter substrate-binding protein, partial [Chloroflexota bacterium]
MDPYITTSGASKGMLWSMYDKLAERDVKMNVIPWLATSWKTLNDTTWQLALRKGVQFHNGEKFDAAAVKFSIERYTNPKLKNGYASLLKPVKAVNAVDDYTVNIVTDAPYALMMEVLSTYCEMLPPKATTANGVTTPIKTPIGTGPYKFVKWQPGTGLTVDAAGPHFSGQPHAKQIQWLVVPENATRLVDLKTGGADLISNVPPLQQKQVTSGGNTISRATSLSSLIVVMSLLKEKPFNNVKVRQALNYAVNKDEIIAKVLNGAATPLSGPFAPGIPGYDPKLKPYPYDPAKAKQLLAEAGYPNGFDLTLSGPNGRYLEDKLVVEAIGGQLDAVGVKTKVDVVGDWPTFVKGIIGRHLQAFFFAQGGILTDATASINWDSTKKGIAWQGYSNSEVNTLIETAPKTLDSQKRNAMYRKMTDLIYQDAPWL